MHQVTSRHLSETNKQTRLDKVDSDNDFTR